MNGIKRYKMHERDCRYTVHKDRGYLHKPARERRSYKPPIYPPWSTEFVGRLTYTFFITRVRLESDDRSDLTAGATLLIDGCFE